jgi:intracellular sulfur oxidation DsrE/DsrF family protein
MGRSLVTGHLIVHAYGSADSDALATALRVARHSAQGLGEGATIQIVVQGPAVKLLTVGTSYEDELVSALISGRIEVTACENSMRSASVDPAELLPMVGTVPSAVAYIAQRQWDGSAYVRF